MTAPSTASTPPRRRASVAPASRRLRPAEREELDKRRRFLLDSLRDLDAQRAAGDLDEDDYQRLRDHYTVEAATVLRTIEAGDRRATAEVARRRQPEGPPRGRRRRPLLIAAVAGLAVAAAVSVASIAAPRVADQPATGTVGNGSAERLTRAHQLESGGDVVEALKLYDAVLADEPDNVEALAYRGWLLKLAGESGPPDLIDRAQASLDRAVAVDPRYPDARFFRGMLLYQNRGDAAGALAEFEAFQASNPPPDLAQAVEGVMQRARADIAARTQAQQPATQPQTGGG